MKRVLFRITVFYKNTLVLPEFIYFSCKYTPFHLYNSIFMYMIGSRRPLCFLSSRHGRSHFKRPLQKRCESSCVLAKYGKMHATHNVKKKRLYLGSVPFRCRCWTIYITPVSVPFSMLNICKMGPIREYIYTPGSVPFSILKICKMGPIRE